MVDAALNQMAARTPADQIGHFFEEIRSWVAADRDGVDVAALEVTDLQTATNRHPWKTGKMFHAAETFFLECSHELPVTKKNGRDVGVIDVDAEYVQDFSSDEYP